MRSLFAALMLTTVAVPALAQEQYVPTGEMLLRQAQTCEQIATAQYQKLSGANQTLTKTADDLTKERDAAKAALLAMTKERDDLKSQK